MFAISYFLLLIVAAIPLALTLLSDRGRDRAAFMRRIYRGAAFILAAGLGIIFFEAALGISLENYWFTELGQRHRYWLALQYRVGIFLAVFIFVGLFLGLNFRVLSAPLGEIPNAARWLAAFLFSAVVAFLAMPYWVAVMRYLGATAAGSADPVFGKDLSFYLLALPLYDEIVSFLIALLVITIAIWAISGLVAYQRRQDFLKLLHESGAFHAKVYSGHDLAADEGVWARWTSQGIVLAMMLCIVLGVSRFLGRYHLVINGHSKVVAGASYGDVRYWIPGYNLMTALLVCSSLHPGNRVLYTPIP